MSGGSTLLSLAIDLVAITVLSFGLYYRRHRRRDLVLGFFGVNVGLYAAALVISRGELSLGLGLGLFGLLSVIRLRSSEITQEEIGYYFVALVLGMTNGFRPDEHWGVAVLLNGVLLGTLYVVDHPRLLRTVRRVQVTLDTVHPDEDALRADLARRLGGTIIHVVVHRVDFVHRHTTVDVRFRPNRGAPAPPAAAESGADVPDRAADASGSAPLGSQEEP